MAVQAMQPTEPEVQDATGLEVLSDAVTRPPLKEQGRRPHRYQRPHDDSLDSGVGSALAPALTPRREWDDGSVCHEKGNQEVGREDADNEWQELEHAQEWDRERSSHDLVDYLDRAENESDAEDCEEDPWPCARTGGARGEQELQLHQQAQLRAARLLAERRKAPTAGARIVAGYS